MARVIRHSRIRSRNRTLKGEDVQSLRQRPEKQLGVILSQPKLDAIPGPGVPGNAPSAIPIRGTPVGQGNPYRDGIAEWLDRQRPDLNNVFFFANQIEIGGHVRGPPQRPLGGLGCSLLARTRRDFGSLRFLKRPPVCHRPDRSPCAVPINLAVQYAEAAQDSSACFQFYSTAREIDDQVRCGIPGYRIFRRESLFQAAEFGVPLCQLLRFV